jgi:hypothetical protein
MRSRHHYRRSHWRSGLILGAALFAWGTGTAYLSAEPATGKVMRVEEDWALVVAAPDVGNNSPQVTCTIAPLDMASGYAAFDINYRTQPNYSPGGLQLHVWNPVEPIVTSDFPAVAMLATPSETITWTQTMQLQEGKLTFQVVNGQSQTWGTFGGDDQAITVNTHLDNLNAYDPNVSLSNSGVSFGSNRVTSLVLKAVRWYDASGKLIRQVTAPQPVYPKP